MRLIDADELRKAFEEVYPLATNEMGGAVNKRIYDIIDNAPTIEPFERIGAICNENCGYRPKDKWIPVTERLPENDEDVLITRVYNGSTHYFIEMSWFNECKFLTQDGEFELPNVVAWMPLLEPYKEGDV